MSEHKVVRDNFKGGAYRRKIPDHVVKRRVDAQEKQVKYLAWFEGKYGAAGQRARTRVERVLETSVDMLTDDDVYALGYGFRGDRRASRKRRMRLRARRGRGAC